MCYETALLYLLGIDHDHKLLVIAGTMRATVGVYDNQLVQDDTFEGFCTTDF